MKARTLPLSLALPGLALTCALASCGASTESTLTPAGARDARERAERFLAEYTATYVDLYADSAEAEWAVNTRIVEGDDTNAERARAAEEALAAFTGSVATIEAARELLAHADRLDELQVLQLERVLRIAAESPQIVPDLVEQRIAADTAQSEALYGFTYRLEGEEVTPNELDELLASELDARRRRAVWEASKEVGPALRGGLEDLVRLRNSCVRALGYSDFFEYMVSEYGMDTEEMAAQMRAINRELRPLYRELHTWARYELAERYDRAVPEQLPAHWLPNRWGQDWSALVEVEGFDLDQALGEKAPEWLVRQAERFYVSLGFQALPASFWERSSLYPVPEGAGYKKNSHASAWHMDLGRDVRCLMSVTPNTRWYETTHHELGHVYYYVCYTNPDVPPLLREGANRAYHEAIGSLMGLAAMQPRFAAGIGLTGGPVEAGSGGDPMRQLLKEALNYVVFIPWSTGTMFAFEQELYADELPPERWNERWWEIVADYQGIVPPEGREVRGERWCDPATKDHVNIDPAAYYDYALSFVLLFQLHEHIAREILHQDPRDTNYYGRPEVGEFLVSIMRPGSSVDWREVLREKTGSELTARPMVDYFAPLLEWLREENAGRTATLKDV